MTKTQRDVRRELKEYQAEEIFHRHEWFAQRVGWAALALLLIAACLGLLGNGPLSHRRIAMKEGTLILDRFVRRDANTQWTIELSPAQTATRTLEVRVSSQFLQRFRLAGITPEPRSQAAAGDYVVFSFASSAPRAQITFHVEPLQIGTSEGEFQIGVSEPSVVQQFVYP